VPANDQGVCGQRPYVLYWMQGTQRLEDNWALRLATVEADRINKPLLVLHTIDSGSPYASARFHTFMLQGAQELATRAEQLGLTYRLVISRGGQHCTTSVERLAVDTALIVTDLFPTEGVAERTVRMASRVECRVLAVDSVGVVPAACFEREEYSARTIRPKLHRLLAAAVEAVEDRAPKRPFPTALVDALPLSAVDPRRFSLAALVQPCNVDHAVAPASARGGLTAARHRLDAFVSNGLTDYCRRRTLPSDAGGTSRLSAHLHYGMISPLEVYTAACGAANARERDAFVEEMLTWRELSLNFCLRNPDFSSLASAPAWAQRSMAAHAADKRPVTYDLDTLERAESADPIWNAGQRELVETGAMHPVMRMLWGKALIEWAPTYDAAFNWMLHLTNKYSLDGRDPASYAGVHWCFGKFDRPFTTRTVWGTIRPMSLTRARLKYDLGDYVARWQPTPAAQVA
jgi:deoxyribodipyrimidine photo-lyase